MKHFYKQLTIFSRELLVFNHWNKSFDNVVSEQIAVTFTENKFYANLQQGHKREWGLWGPVTWQIPSHSLLMHVNVIKIICLPQTSKPCGKQEFGPMRVGPTQHETINKNPSSDSWLGQKSGFRWQKQNIRTVVDRKRLSNLFFCELV